jgi:hypothetical protein
MSPVALLAVACELADALEAARSATDAAELVEQTDREDVERRPKGFFK